LLLTTLMIVNLHKKARTTPEIRLEIQASTLSERELARTYGVSRPTIRKWEQREEVFDRSHRPHRLATTLSPEQEAVVVELRTTLKLSVDDLLVVVREFIHDGVSRSGLDRCLRRHGVSNLAALRAQDEGVPPPKKSFKDYEHGFVHLDVKYLPQLPGEAHRRYLFVAIDRATRWVYLEIHPEKTAQCATAFLERLTAAAPFTIAKLLTDNGAEFTDRFLKGGDQPSGQHDFDQACTEHHIEHRLIPPRHPQTNGMVERFNGRISEILTTTHFNASEDLTQTLERYLHIYNHHIPQRALGHHTFLQALQAWYKKRPDLYKCPVSYQSGLDTVSSSFRLIQPLK